MIILALSIPKDFVEVATDDTVFLQYVLTRYTKHMDIRTNAAMSWSALGLTIITGTIQHLYS